MTTRRLDGRVAIITGAASGIGEACARLFASEGASVVVADRNPEQGECVTRSIRDLGGEATFVHVDVSQEADCKHVVDEAVARYGKLDILVNNAGVFVNRLIHETSNEEFDLTFDVNVRAPFWLCKYSIPHMLEQGKGAICMMASKTGLVAQRDSPLYCSSKGALVLLTKAIAMDYATKGIRANAVCPGIIDTPMLAHSYTLQPNPTEFRKHDEMAQPIGRLGNPAEVAQAVLYLCSDESSYITGVALPVDGGFTAM